MPRWWVLATSIFLWSTMVQAEVKRPLVLIPGILGSQLCDGTGSVVWGGVGSLWNFSRLELKPDGSSEDLRTCGVISHIVSIGPFWQADVYAPLLNELRSIGYNETNLLIFDYDW